MEQPRPGLESIKEVGRLIVSGLVAWLLTEGTVFALVSLFGAKYNLNESSQMLMVTVLTIVIKAVDKYVHEDPTNPRNGFIPF